MISSNLLPKGGHLVAIDKSCVNSCAISSQEVQNSFIWMKEFFPFQEVETVAAQGKMKGSVDIQRFPLWCG